MPRRSAEPRYRRRVVLELTRDESDLLDRLADSHGTIRGAVLVGLRELEADRSADLEAQVRDLTAQLATAKRSAADERKRLAAELAAATAQVATSRKELKTTQAERKAAREDLREARAKLSNARGAAETQRLALERDWSTTSSAVPAGSSCQSRNGPSRPLRAGSSPTTSPMASGPSLACSTYRPVLFWRPSPSGESKP